jgi:hypothetical protein
MTASGRRGGENDMIRMRQLLGVALAATIVSAGAVCAAEGEKPLDNAEIMKLTKLEMGDDVIIAKIKAASTVQFATTTDDLVKLKSAGVSKAVMAAMVDRTNAGSAPGHAASGAAASAGSGGGMGAPGGVSSVTLVAKDGTTTLKPIEGEVKSIVAPFVGFKRFIVFDELAATVRTKDRKPSITIAAAQDPSKGGYWLVKLDQDTDEEDKNRGMDVESPGMWGGTLSSAPDDDFKIKVEKAEEKPGVWRFVPIKDLKPGEYGVYIGKGEQTGIVYDFGVDK